MLSNKDLFRVEEVASYFDVTPRTVYRWIEHGHLEAERPGPGKSIRVPRDSILRCRDAGQDDDYE